MRLTGLFSPHRASGPQVGVLRQLRAGHFFDFSCFCCDEMLAEISKVLDGSEIFTYAIILCSIMYERVVLLRPVVAVPFGGP